MGVSGYGRFSPVYGTTAHTPLKTDLKPAQPFLHPQKRGWFDRWRHPSSHYFHVTTYQHIPSIMARGLDPKHRWINGADARLKFEDTPEPSKQVVFAADYEYGTQKYIELYEKHCRDTDWLVYFEAPANLADSAVVLRMPRQLPGVSWTRDEDDESGMATRSVISPDHIEALTTEGWVPISHLVETATALKETGPDPKRLSRLEQERLVRRYFFKAAFD